MLFMIMHPLVYQLCIVTTRPCQCLFAGHRLGSSRLWTHLTVRGSERSAVSVSCHPICPPLWWNQLLRGSWRWQQTAELPGAFKWWESAERQSQQVTWQVISRWVFFYVYMHVKNITLSTPVRTGKLDCFLMYSKGYNIWLLSVWKVVV